MSWFKGGVEEQQRLFKNEGWLDPEFIPKLLPFREGQQTHVADCVKPLLQGRNGRNVFVYGPPGIGKTAAIRWVLRDLEENTDDVVPVYVNCWQKNTTFQIYVELCNQLGYKFTQNKRSDELFTVIKGIVNKRAAVFVFDEIDKVEDFDFLYALMAEVYKRTLVLITNYKEWLGDVEERIMSRLTPDVLEFKQYSRDEFAGILKQRIGLAFMPNVWMDDAFEAVVEKAAEAKDMRVGLFLLRESGYAAEAAGSKKVSLDHVKAAIVKADRFHIKSADDLADDTKRVLDCVKANSGEKIGELFKKYQGAGGQGTYKTFTRKVDKLERDGFVSQKKVFGGREGNSTLVEYAKEKKLSDFASAAESVPGPDAS
jgi:cell division control protein 6